MYGKMQGIKPGNRIEFGRAWGADQMATRTWNKDRAGKRIDARLAELPVKDVEIREYVRDTDLTGLPMNVAYRVDGVQLYADILNLRGLRGQRFRYGSGDDHGCQLPVAVAFPHG